MTLHLSERVKTNAESRVAKLTADKNTFLSYATQIAPAFSGPPAHYYQKMMKLVSQHNITTLLPSEIFADTLYATLTAWGMHRMGPNGAKLKDFTDFRKNIEACRKELDFLHGYQLSDLGGYLGNQLAGKLGTVFSMLDVMKSESKLVGNSKTLHFMLPRLVPPIDREYTLKFFLDTKTISYDEKEVFFHIISEYRSIASKLDLKESYGSINSRVGVPKLIDEAVVGFVIKELKTPHDVEESTE